MASEGNDEKAGKRDRSTLAAFLGMVMSALVSLFIAGTMFTVGALHQKREDDRDRRALVQFLAVEVADIYAEACRSAHGVFVNSRYREATAPRMAGARTLAQAISLGTDPALVATLRTIYGRHARVEKDLASDWAFYRARKKLTQSQIGRAIDECTAMGEEVRQVLEMAAKEGAEEAVLSGPQQMCAEAAKLTEALVAQKGKLLPDVQLSETSIDLGTWSGGSTFSIKVSNFSEGPLTVTSVASSQEGVGFYLANYRGRKEWPAEKETPEVKPDESVTYIIEFPKPGDLPDGPFKWTITIETDCPGYERLTIPVKGTVVKVEICRRDTFEAAGSPITSTRTKSLSLKNNSAKLLTVTTAYCWLAGAKVDLPSGNTAEAGRFIAVEERIQAKSLPPGPFEWTLVLETDCPGYERIAIPFKGTVKK